MEREPNYNNKQTFEKNQKYYRERQDSGHKEHKKKKKHKQQRQDHHLNILLLGWQNLSMHSHSDDSRRHKHKKRHSRSRDNSNDSRAKSKKHQKDHKHDKEANEYSRHKDHRQRSRENQYDRRDDRNRNDRDSRSYRDDRQKRGDSRDRHNRDDKKYSQKQTPKYVQKILDQKDPYFQQRRQIQKVRKYDPQKGEQLEQQLEKKIIFQAKQKQYEQMKQKFKQAQKQMQEAKREDHTILVYCLPLKARQKDIWNFFNSAVCGKIRDIRIIKDARSGKSKGVAYVQFYTSQSVQKALTMTQRPFQLKGRSFMGLKIQHSQAQKNRAAAAAKRMRVTKPIDPYEQVQQTIKRQTKVRVGGLTEKLAEIQQSELKQIFDPFGSIDYVDIHRDPQTGRCKGFAFIQYTNVENAKAAVKEMDGLIIGGQKISVTTVSVVQKGQVSNGDDYLHSYGNKMQLMSNLARDAPSHSNLQRPPISTVSTPYIIMTGMFKMEGTTPIFFQELRKQVLSQCSQFGIVQKSFIEKNNQGNVWIKFSDTQSAIKAQQKMNGKFFDNHKIFCYFVTQNTYQLRVPN